MTSNRAAVLLEPGRIVVEDRAVPDIGPHDVLVRVRSVGVCGSDVHYFEHGRIGDFVVRSPLVGYELLYWVGSLLGALPRDSSERYW